MVTHVGQECVSTQNIYYPISSGDAQLLVELCRLEVRTHANDFGSIL